eukprot:1029836-Rhodomonas_salina.1
MSHSTCHDGNALAWQLLLPNGGELDDRAWTQYMDRLRSRKTGALKREVRPPSAWPSTCHCRLLRKTTLLSWIVCRCVVLRQAWAEMCGLGREQDMLLCFAKRLDYDTVESGRDTLDSDSSVSTMQVDSHNSKRATAPHPELD